MRLLWVLAVRRPLSGSFFLVYGCGDTPTPPEGPDDPYHPNRVRVLALLAREGLYGNVVGGAREGAGKPRWPPLQINQHGREWA